MKRAPSVQDYARMSERARAAAAEIASRQVTELEERRNALFQTTEWLDVLYAGAENVRRQAITDYPNDTAEVQRARLVLAHEEHEQLTRRKMRDTRQRRRAAA